MSCGLIPPPGEARETARTARLEEYRTQGQGKFWVPEAERGRPATLTPLGRKLLGADDWD